MSKAMMKYLPARDEPAVVVRLSLGQLLSVLVGQVADIGNGNEPAGRPDPAIERWADSDYVYLETDLPDRDGPEADISIQSGHIFMRIARMTAGVVATIRMEE
jgi:hypothetical protein